MAQIGETDWDDELFTDRVDILKVTQHQSPSGQSLPLPSSVGSDIPCKFFYGGGRETVELIGDLATDQVAVAFAQDVHLEPGDRLQPRPPSVGSPIRVGPYRYDSTLEFWMTIGTQTT